MFHEPHNDEEARAHRYGTWPGNPAGSAYKSEQCAAEVVSYPGWYGHQCLHKRGHGPAGLYCKTHAKKVRQPQPNQRRFGTRTADDGPG